MIDFKTILLPALTLLVVIVGGGWLLIRTLKKSDDPGRLIAKWVITAVVLIVLGVFAKRALGASGGSFAGSAGLAMVIASSLAVVGILLGVLWASSLGATISRWFENLYLGSGETEPQPFYAIAEAKRKHGDYRGAVAEIEAQLRAFPNDFRGHLLLAEIKAENLQDLSGAELVIERFVSPEKGRPLNHVGYALHRLADWHLKLAQDPDAARATLERLLALMPDGEQAQVARQRLAHLPSREFLAETHEPPTKALAPHEESLGLRDDFTGLKAPVEDPATTAANYVKHLQQFPYDNEAREKLALIYARHYQRLDLAADQLEQLIAVANQPAHEVIRWLNLLADLQLKLGGDLAAARATLQRIVDGFPDSAAAETTGRRLAYLQTESKANKEGRVVKLGSYEQNLGLKGRSEP
ncbi:MAG: tetratricopeptide repeat protein [Verrucomicrobia bacterium]|nr:tetratricopeptide repeat protein [Verrucomicrobiota bacterium]